MLLQDIMSVYLEKNLAYKECDLHLTTCANPVFSDSVETMYISEKALMSPSILSVCLVLLSEEDVTVAEISRPWVIAITADGQRWVELRFFHKPVPLHIAKNARFQIRVITDIDKDPLIPLQTTELRYMPGASPVDPERTVFPCHGGGAVQIFAEDGRIVKVDA